MQPPRETTEREREDDDDDDDGDDGDEDDDDGDDDDNDDDEGEATRDRISEFSIDLRCCSIDAMILVMSCDVKVGHARRWDVM